MDEFLFREFAVKDQSAVNECRRNNHHISLTENMFISFSFEDHQVTAQLLQKRDDFVAQLAVAFNEYFYPRGVHFRCVQDKKRPLAAMSAG